MDPCIDQKYFEEGPAGGRLRPTKHFPFCARPTRLRTGRAREDAAGRGASGVCSGVCAVSRPPNRSKSLVIVFLCANSVTGGEVPNEELVCSCHN
jgi:hypothetical protein